MERQKKIPEREVASLNKVKGEKRTGRDKDREKGKGK